MEPTCVHCGSDKEPYFSRSEPMGDYCSECGHNFYERGTSETDRTERRWRDYSLLNVDDIFDFARRLERERDELKSDLEFRRGLFQLQEQQLNEVRAERDKHHEDADAFLDKWSKAQERAIDAERERDAERALADRLTEALRVAYGLITRHHEVGVTQELGCFCPVCHRDGKEPEMDQIIAALAAWKEARSE